MTLRVRLLLALIGTTVAVVPILLWLTAAQDRRALEDGIRTLAMSTMNDWGLESCRERPERFAGGTARFNSQRMPFRPPEAMRKMFEKRSERYFGPLESRVNYEIWAYRSDFASDNPEAPEIPAELKRALEGGESISSEEYLVEGDARTHTAVLMTTPWVDDPCALVLVRHSAPPAPDRAAERIKLVAGASLALLLAAMAACYPIVRRIRGLTGRVREAATNGYTHDIEFRGHDEAAHLATAFNEAGRSIRSNMTELADRERALREFVANTTHDVMLPITVLQGHLAELEHLLASSPVQKQELVSACFLEVGYLASIINNLAAMAKLEGADLDQVSVPVDLGALLRRVEARHTPLARARRIELEMSLPEDPVAIPGDVTLIEQAMGNIVHNAIRHNRDEGHVAVILELEEGGFSLRIIDDGPGVEPAELDRLCERRFRSDEARSRVPEGAGIGLHIARSVFARHGLEMNFAISEFGGLEVRVSGPITEGTDTDQKAELSTTAARRARGV